MVSVDGGEIKSGGETIKTMTENSKTRKFNLKICIIAALVLVLIVIIVIICTVNSNKSNSIQETTVQNYDDKVF